MYTYMHILKSALLTVVSKENFAKKNKEVKGFNLVGYGSAWMTVFQKIDNK